MNTQPIDPETGSPMSKDHPDYANAVRKQQEKDAADKAQADKARSDQNKNR